MAPSPHLRALLVVMAALACLGAGAPARADAPAAASDEPERRHAFELYEQGRMVDAMPLLEKLAWAHPKEGLLFERWGAAVLSYAQTLPDSESRRKARVRARELLVRARDLGQRDDLVMTLLEMVPEDGGGERFSAREDVERAMREGEAHFARGDYDAARQAYLRALLLDPSTYEAALFTGDVFFRQRKPAAAGEWYARAIRIAPDRETAYRYWGDALVAAGHMDEARTKFIEAIIADPYHRAPWAGVSQWAARNQVELRFPRVRDWSAAKVENGKVTIRIDDSLVRDSPEGMAWIAYALTRGYWQREKFAHEFPSEPAYRHSLREETDALQTLLKVFRETGKRATAGKTPAVPSPDLALLVHLDAAGLVEAFVLITRADAGIREDYPAYRAANREKIRRFLDEYVVPKTPG